MKVKCVNNGGRPTRLTVNNIYNVLREKRIGDFLFYTVYNDCGALESFYPERFDVVDENTATAHDNTACPVQTEEYTGGSSSYYKIKVEHPTTLINPYEAECNDIIEALGMNFAEGNIFKALWRRANARKNGIKKKGYIDGKYDAEKILFFAERLLKMEEE